MRWLVGGLRDGRIPGFAGAGGLLRRSVGNAVPGRRASLHCGGRPAGAVRRCCAARARGALRNSLRSLRSLRSNSRNESDDEARCARRPEPFAARRRSRRCARRPGTALPIAPLGVSGERRFAGIEPANRRALEARAYRDVRARCCSLSLSHPLSLSLSRERVGGVAGLSSRMRRAREVIRACKPECALQVRVGAAAPLR